LTNLHPAVVHFAIGLFTASVILDIIGFSTKREYFNSAGWLNLTLAVVASLVSVLTGFLAEDSVIVTKEAHRLMEIHETLGLVVLGIAAILMIWRLFNQGPLSNRQIPFYIIIAVAGLLFLLASGHYGGEMVYEYGVGVKPVMKQTLQDEKSADTLITPHISNRK